MTPKDRREIIDEYIDHEQEQVDKKYQALIAGSLTLASFFSFLRQKIAEWHAVAGHAGFQQMNGRRWQSVGDKIQSELEYLKAFQIEATKSAASTVAIAEAAEKIAAEHPDIPAGLEAVVRDRVEEALRLASPSTAQAEIAKAVEAAVADSIDEAAPVGVSVAADTVEAVGSRFEDLIWGQIGSRGRMYADAAYGTYENSVKASAGEAGAVGVRRVCEEDEASCDECVAAASDEYVSMDEVTEIGTLTCMNNCRCYFEFDYHGVEPLQIDRELYA